MVVNINVSIWFSDKILPDVYVRKMKMNESSKGYEAKEDDQFTSGKMRQKAKVVEVKLYHEYELSQDMKRCTSLSHYKAGFYVHLMGSWLTK